MLPAHSCRRIAFAVATVCLSFAPVKWSSPARAGTYDLTSDFSNTANPNGAWSYSHLGANLAPQTVAVNTGSWSSVFSNGYFAYGGTDLGNNNPFVVKSAADASSAGLPSNAFLAGDVLLHTANDGLPAFITWTAPTSGIVSNLNVAVWYAHLDQTARSNEVTFSLNSAPQQNWALSYASSYAGRDHAGTFSLGTLSVAAGDMLVLSFVTSAGSQYGYGSIDGVRESFTFDPVATPLPAALPLFGAGAGLFGLLGWRRKRKA